MLKNLMLRCFFQQEAHHSVEDVRVKGTLHVRVQSDTESTHQRQNRSQSQISWWLDLPTVGGSTT